LCWTVVHILFISKERVHIAYGNYIMKNRSKNDHYLPLGEEGKKFEERKINNSTLAVGQKKKRQLQIAQKFIFFFGKHSSTPNSVRPIFLSSVS